MKLIINWDKMKLTCIIKKNTHSNKQEILLIPTCRLLVLNQTILHFFYTGEGQSRRVAWKNELATLLTSEMFTKTVLSTKEILCYCRKMKMCFNEATVVLKNYMHVAFLCFLVGSSDDLFHGG